MKTLTFLVPCYNVENCVGKCIESMLLDDILDDIEILLVNDGSKDSTLNLLQEYENKYRNTIRVIDKPNGGWGTAINRGIREAQGKYIKEVDADDWVSTENLPTYIAFLKEHDIDYIATDYTEYFKAEDKYIRHSYHREIYDNPMSLNEFWEKHPSAWDFPIHAITYRTQMLRDCSLRVGDRYYGDIEYNLYPLPYVKTICVLQLNVTVYFRGSDEQSTSTAGYAKHYKDYAAMSQRITDFFHTVPQTLHPALRQFIHETVYGTAVRTYHLMLSPIYAGKTPGVAEDLRQYDRWLKSFDKDIYHHCARQRKHGIAFIRLWRWTGINILKLR
ncbi:MAG: glycosyltransferase family 2 protein [Bacteroidales bacterium]|nr:glycosyltransferase family 2 protein [Bacteroidales bacterium]